MSRLSFISLLIILSFFACRQEGTDQQFTELSRHETGIDFRNMLKEDENFNIFKYQYFNNGGGLAVGDFNNDGLQDLVFTGNMVKNRLYVNQGDLEFEDQTVRSGIAEKEGWCTGATTVDINADGWLDLYICRAGYPFDDLRSNLLFVNNGDLTFTESAAEYGIDDSAFSTHSTFFDYDLDGDLDLFVLNHSTVEYSRGSLEVLELRKKKDPAYTNKLFRNDNGRFTNVTEEAGIYGNVLTFSLGLSVADINQDGWPDIYIGNDFNEPDYLFINQKDGTFSDAAEDWFDHTAMFSMGSDIADFNNDGLPDLVSLDMLPESNYQQKMHSGADNYDKVDLLAKNGFFHQSSRNMLQLNNGDGSFTELGQFAGISNTNWSWAPLFFDFDNDGNKDLFIANGYPKDHTDMDFLNFTANEVVKINQGEEAIDFDGYMEQMPPIILPNYFYQNKGGLQFENQTASWGLDQPNVSQSAAYADLDNDGDLDLVLNNTGDYATVYRNNSEAQNNHHYLKVKLLGSAQNPLGVGAKIYAYAGEQVFYLDQQPVRGFQSTVDPVLHFGLGEHDHVDSLRVLSPLGGETLMKNVAANQTLEVDLSQAEGSVSATKKMATLLEELNLVRFEHEENNFNDFKVQSLLPWFFSCQGPALATGDMNGDGLEDVFAGNATGAAGVLWLQQADGQLVNSSTTAFADYSSAYEETAAVFFDANGDGQQDIYLASGSYEFPAGDDRLTDRLYLNIGNGKMKLASQSLPDLKINTNCVAAADADGDGDIDLFIGGGYQYGAYPQTYASYLLVNDGNGQFNKIALDAGHVAAAQWADMDGDEIPELVAVGEWTPVQIYSYQNGQLQDVSHTFLESPERGLWQSIEVADMDGDGDLDLIAGNLGLNTQLAASTDEPLELYAADFDQNGSIDPLLFYYVQGTSWPFASRDDLIGQLPHLKRNFLYFKDYANAQVTDVLSSEEIAAAEIFTSQTLATTYYENVDGKLQPRPLSELVQLAPVKSIVAADVNADGYQDLLMGGNILPAKVKLGRLEGNRGMILLGDGAGGFRPSAAANAGLKFRGSVSNMQLLESVDNFRLLVGINDGPLQVYQRSGE